MERVEAHRAAKVDFVEANDGTGPMSPRSESINENGAPPPTQNVEQGETCPRKRDNLDITPIVEFDCESGRRVEADAVV
jgi:hypothetical protein